MRSGDDNALVDVESHVRKPGLARQVRRGLAFPYAPAEERENSRCGLVRHPVRPQRPDLVRRVAQYMGYKPRGFVRGIEGAMPERNPGPAEAARSFADERAHGPCPDARRGRFAQPSASRLSLMLERSSAGCVVREFGDGTPEPSPGAFAALLMIQCRLVGESALAIASSSVILFAE